MTDAKYRSVNSNGFISIILDMTYDEHDREGNNIHIYYFFGFVLGFWLRTRGQ
jgi:hypothetical protein